MPPTVACSQACAVHEGRSEAGETDRTRRIPSKMVQVMSLLESTERAVWIHFRSSTMPSKVVIPHETELVVFFVL